MKGTNGLRHKENNNWYLSDLRFCFVFYKQCTCNYLRIPRCSELEWTLDII